MTATKVKTKRPGRKSADPFIAPNAMRLVRLSRNLSVIELSRKTAIPPSSIRRWELTGKGIAQEKLKLLAAYLDVPLFVLYMTPKEAQIFLKAKSSCVC